LDKRDLSRRAFLKAGLATAGAGAAAVFLGKLAFLQGIEHIDNPLAFYPNRDWERAYRDLYRSDH
jgi:nitrate reductase alpha subunit